MLIRVTETFSSRDDVVTLATPLYEFIGAFAFPCVCMFVDSIASTTLVAHVRMHACKESLAPLNCFFSN
jgi:hypothetical protein